MWVEGPWKELVESTGTKKSDFNLNDKEKQQTSQEENFKNTVIKEPEF